MFTYVSRCIVKVLDPPPQKKQKNVENTATETVISVSFGSTTRGFPQTNWQHEPQTLYFDSDNIRIITANVAPRKTIRAMFSGLAADALRSAAAAAAVTYPLGPAGTPSDSHDNSRYSLTGKLGPSFVS